MLKIFLTDDLNQIDRLQKINKDFDLTKIL